MNLDEILKDLADGEAVSLEVPDDDLASRMWYVLKQKRTQLEKGKDYWAQRKRRLEVQILYLEMRIEEWARQTHRDTGLKSFPVGEGMAKIQKAQTVTKWDEVAATGWLRSLLEVDPLIATKFDRKRAIEQHVKWGPTVQGTRQAVLEETGEILPGLVQDDRLGQSTVSINTEE